MITLYDLYDGSAEFMENPISTRRKRREAEAVAERQAVRRKKRNRFLSNAAKVAGGAALLSAGGYGANRFLGVSPGKYALGAAGVGAGTGLGYLGVKKGSQYLANRKRRRQEQQG